MHNIKRNKKILEYLLKELLRIDTAITIEMFFLEYIMPEIGTLGSIEVQGKISREIDPTIFDNDQVLIETLKILGIMEVSKDKKELEKNIEKREKIKGNKKELTDFDKILKGIMKVPNKNDNE